MRRNTLFRQYDKLTVPCHLSGYQPCPFEFGERVFLGNVVSASARLCTSSCQCDCAGDILHEAHRPAPTRNVLLEQDCPSTVTDALDYGKKSVQGIAWSIHHRKSQDRSGKSWI